jgi:hypothetical protein
VAASIVGLRSKAKRFDFPGRECPLRVYCVEKLGEVDGWKKMLSGSTYQNRRYSTSSKQLKFCDHPTLLPFDFFNTIVRELPVTSGSSRPEAEATASLDQGTVCRHTLSW